MNQLFVASSNISNDRITITGADVNHVVNVLRMKRGERTSVVCRDNGLTYGCVIAELGPDRVECVIEDVQSESRELPIEVTIYQGLPKSDKLEFVIQKAVEMGAYRIVPVAMKRSVVKFDAAKASKKNARWNAIAESAASQSKRNVIPEVSDLKTLKEAVSDASGLDAILLPYELADGIDESRRILNELKESGVGSVGVFIGPEGGFDETEVRELKEAGASIITLGNRILRTETAPIAVLAWLTYVFEN